MASCFTSTSLSGNPLPEFLSKLRPFEFSNLDTEYANCVSSDLKTLAVKDKKLREFQSIFDAQKRFQSALTTFLKEKAEEERKAEESEEEDSSNSKDEKIEIPVFSVPSVSLENILLLENKATLAKLEVRSFIFKLWLRRIQLTRQEDQEKHNSLQDFENAIYNAHEVIKQSKDFVYKHCYNKQMLPYYEDHLEKFYTKALEEKERASFEMADEDLAIFFSNSARICALLGLQLDFLDRLKEIPTEDCNHLTLCDWIVTFLGSNYESIDSTLTDKNFLSRELLAAIGFDPLSSGVETIMARAGSTQQHIEACEMAELFIKDEFRYNLFLSPLVGRFPFQSNITNMWFQLSNTTDETGKETNEDLSHVNIINLVTEESRASKSMLSGFVSEDEQNVILFHGTDHQSASDILLRGIDLCEGRPKRDFSCGYGFYLTNNFDEALNWARSTTSKPAMLIFRVNRSEYLDVARKLNLYENEERWHEIVFSFRSGKRTAKTQKSLNKYDLIEGPVGTVRRSESGELVIEPKPSSFQMCLISDDFAEKFRQTLHSIVFLDTS